MVHAPHYTLFSAEMPRVEGERGPGSSSGFHSFTW